MQHQVGLSIVTHIFQNRSSRFYSHRHQGWRQKRCSMYVSYPYLQPNKFNPCLAVTAPGPVVAIPPPSMLRGKTLEEIVNRWTTELEANVREFNKFAAEVAVWDRALIENGNNVGLTSKYMCECCCIDSFIF